MYLSLKLVYYKFQWQIHYGSIQSVESSHSVHSIFAHRVLQRPFFDTKNFRDKPGILIQKEAIRNLYCVPDRWMFPCFGGDRVEGWKSHSLGGDRMDIGKDVIWKQMSEIMWFEERCLLIIDVVPYRSSLVKFPKILIQGNTKLSPSDHMIHGIFVDTKRQ